MWPISTNILPLSTNIWPLSTNIWPLSTNIWPLSTRNPPFHPSLSLVIFSRFKHAQIPPVSLSFPAITPSYSPYTEFLHFTEAPIQPIHFIFHSLLFPNTPDCNLKFDGHHSSYGRLICHYCLKIPQVFVFIYVLCLQFPSFDAKVCSSVHYPMDQRPSAERDAC